MAAGSNDLAAQVLRDEYAELKAEQRDRIGTRDHLLYLYIGAMVAVGAGVLSRGSTHLLLLQPPIAVFLGWTYLMNDRMVTAIRRYLRTHTQPELTALSGATSRQLLRWEEPGRDRRFRGRKRIQLGVDLAAWAAAPAVALTLYAANGPGPWPLWLAAAAELAAVAVLACQIVVYAPVVSRWPAGD